jgi:hypothetical protein
MRGNKGLYKGQGKEPHGGWVQLEKMRNGGVVGEASWVGGGRGSRAADGRGGVVFTSKEQREVTRKL